MSEKLKISEQDVLLVVDIQNDFCSGGSLAIAGSDEIIPRINRIAERFEHVVLSQDWHPPGHISFASSHQGKKPHELIDVNYGKQELWPEHCLQDTPGAAFHKDLHIPHAQLILRKGYRREIDCYSVFYENDHKIPSGLAAYLRECGLTRLFLAGLAFDFCVRYSAEDAHKDGFEVLVIEDACRGIGLGDSIEQTQALFKNLKIPCIAAAQII